MHNKNNMSKGMYYNFGEVMIIMISEFLDITKKDE